MKLTDNQFKMIGNIVDNHDLSRWGIVKDHLPMPPLPLHIPTIFANFEIPRMTRILPQDVRLQNYRESKIVDLSSTLTAPCPEWSEFLFNLFYEKTIYGVFGWFGGRTKGFASNITIPAYQGLSPSLPSFLCSE
jgi:hypothetical protein